jgi:hypothetical protein
MRRVPKPVVDKIDLRPGDHWTYQAIDDITSRTKFTADYTVTEIRGTPYGQNITTTSLEARERSNQCCYR